MSVVRLISEDFQEEKDPQQFELEENSVPEIVHVHVNREISK